MFFPTLAATSLRPPSSPTPFWVFHCSKSLFPWFFLHPIFFFLSHFVGLPRPFPTLRRLYPSWMAPPPFFLPLLLLPLEEDRRRTTTQDLLFFFFPRQTYWLGTADDNAPPSSLPLRFPSRFRKPGHPRNCPRSTVRFLPAFVLATVSFRAEACRPRFFGMISEFEPPLLCSSVRVFCSPSALCSIRLLSLTQSLLSFFFFFFQCLFLGSKTTTTSPRLQLFFPLSASGSSCVALFPEQLPLSTHCFFPPPS